MNILEINNLSKSYISESANDLLFRILLDKKPTSNAKVVLENINLNIKKGESFGVIGRNGAGKSTLLQIIAGILKPSTGSITVKGRVNALLELGSGFNPEFTGVENIYLSGSILGLSKNNIDKKIDEIIKFADIGNYINKPVRMYSTGMLMRVAFSVAIALEPDLLIIDEALSVGDILFQQKCISKLRELKQKGVSLLVVTHDTSFVLNICSNALWLDFGKVLFIGRADECVTRYLAAMAQKSIVSLEDNSAKSHRELINRPSETPLNISNANVIGNDLVYIQNIWILNSNIETPYKYKIGDTCIVTLEIKSKNNLKNISAGLELRDRLGQVLFVTGLRVIKNPINEMFAGEVRLVEISFQLNLSPGQYTIDVGCGSGVEQSEVSYYRITNVFVLELYSSPEDDIVHGMVKLPYQVKCT